ncbi:signal peptidase I [Herbiconiux sp. VKM Ac-1786]|uniref:signal peptidase I n=1 Tax=Herbiconiux sp. VKM Ac-1786 TaxID=2783824 RepID=UPI00188AA955|nr:signal peptidase I [Herbiconiux sp. VKM Ac-1786]MBF4571067.1 signal peptidase I [Herbiconiux sp. VKM Ac-1786]
MTDTSVPSHERREDTAGGRSDSSQSRRSRSAWLFARDLVIIFVIALLASVLIKTFLVRSFYIPSGSMENTLQVDDRILVNQLEPNLIPISRGDVVVFKDPGGWLMPTVEQPKNPLAAAVDWVLEGVGLAADDANDHLIKRVIGLPGDHVVCCNALGQMEVNDIPLDENSYLKLPDGVSAVSQEPFDITVPADSLWVMGDNRYNSADSRFNQDKPGKGFVPEANVVGRAVLVTWPIDHWGWLDNHGNVFDGIPSREGAAKPLSAPSVPSSSSSSSSSEGVVAAPALPGAVQ